MTQGGSGEKEQGEAASREGEWGSGGGEHTTHPPPRQRRHIKLLSATMPVRELDLLCLIDDEVECAEAVFGVEIVAAVLGPVAVDGILVVVDVAAVVVGEEEGVDGGDGGDGEEREGERGGWWGGDGCCGGEVGEEGECKAQWYGGWGDHHCGGGVVEEFY